MTKWTRRAALATAASLAAAWPVRKPRSEEPRIGRLTLRDPPVAPAGVHWTGPDRVVHTLAEYAGRGVVLNLWATWCVPCIEELPSLAALAVKIAAVGIAVVPISSDTGGASVVQHFYLAHGIDGLGVWLDERSQMVEAVGAIGLPTTLIIDRRGREVARLLGPADWSAAGTVETLRALCDL